MAFIICDDSRPLLSFTHFHASRFQFFKLHCISFHQLLSSVHIVLDSRPFSLKFVNKLIKL